jgi:predicted ferric reductase
MIALSMDEFIDFTWFDILVPGVSTWEPLATSLGIVAFWTMVAVSFSFYIKKQIGQAAWRSIHYMSIGAFAAALAHGIMAGTDTLNPWVAGGYAAAAVSVLLLTIIRIIGAGTPGRTAPLPARERTSPSS